MFLLVVALLLDSLTLVLSALGDSPGSGIPLSSQSLSNLDRNTFSRAVEEKAQERYYNDGVPMSIEELDKEVYLCSVYYFPGGEEKGRVKGCRGENKVLLAPLTINKIECP